MAFATGAAPAAPAEPRNVYPQERLAHPGPIGNAPVAARFTVGQGPGVPTWTTPQMVRPASAIGAEHPAQPSAFEPLYSGGDAGWNAQQGTGLNAAIAAEHPQRIPHLYRTGMTGASGFDGRVSTQQYADGTAGLSGHAPILSPALIPRLRSTRGYNAAMRKNSGGVATQTIPSVFVPVGR